MIAQGAPAFLCIGAQKAGTTWLHENLIQHPDIWLPPVKELHVLDHAPPSLMKRWFGKASHHRLAREHLWKVLLRGGGGRKDLHLAWLIAGGSRDWAWYGRLFEHAGARVAGEICPGYARLDEQVIAALAARYPNMKIIYLLRDPVDRAWSSVAMHFRKSGSSLVTEHDRRDIMAQLRKTKSFAHCSYRRNIEAWSRHFPERQFYFGFFDRIREDPEAYLAEILAFLGVGSEFKPRNPSKPVNQGKGEKIETGLEREIGTLLLPEALYIHQKFDNLHTARWLEHVKQIAAG